jgi:hypothetical protein
MKIKRARATAPAFRLTASHTIFPTVRAACRRRLLRVADAAKSVVAIENAGGAINQIAQTTRTWATTLKPSPTRRSSKPRSRSAIPSHRPVAGSGPHRAGRRRRSTWQHEPAPGTDRDRNQPGPARASVQAMNRAIARYWQAAAAQTQAWKTSW